MPEKPSYEELERRVRELKEQNVALVQAIEKLRESEEKFKTIFEYANDHIAYIGLDDRIIDVNRKFEDIFGHSREEMIGKKFYDIGILSPEQWKEFTMHSRKLIAVGLPQRSVFEFEAIRKDGGKVYMEPNPKVVIREGQPLGILCITRDVTERKLAEEALRESEEKFKTIFENANDHIVYIDVDGTVIDINRAFEDILGYKREDVVGKKFYEFGAMNPDDWQTAIDASNELLKGKTIDRVLEFEATASDGSNRYFSWCFAYYYLPTIDTTRSKEPFRKTLCRHISHFVLCRLDVFIMGGNFNSPS